MEGQKRYVLFPDIGYISTYPPRECGIATFCDDLIATVHSTPFIGRPLVAAIVEPFEEPTAYGEPVRFLLRRTSYGDHVRVATFFNDSSAAVVSLQHEFGIFGGSRGSWVCAIAEHLRKPLVTTLHTVLPAPHPEHREIIRYLSIRSRRVVVMNPIAVELLERDYGLSPRKIVVIWHGAPEPPATDPAEVKRQLGLEGHFVVCTFGLLSRGKGIEYAIAALPEVVAQYPDVLYLVLGETHPNVRRAEGESYRAELEALAQRLGVSPHVRFLNRYLSRQELLTYLHAADVYITPYLSAGQIVSGTLTYAIAFGKAVISTPYLYAQVLCSHGRGILVPFRDSGAIAAALKRLRENPEELRLLQQRARMFGLQLAWKRVGHRYAQLFREVIQESLTPTVAVPHLRRKLVTP
jgi:glycosyltransferase involved in cell wall biosynthesis